MNIIAHIRRMVGCLALTLFAVSATELRASETAVREFLRNYVEAFNRQDLEAVSATKEGIVSGTLYNTQTDKAQSVQGQVDKETQRVAFRVGESEDIVVETGLYNLTQSEAPVLVHFGADRVENWLLVRLDQPENQDSGE